MTKVYIVLYDKSLDNFMIEGVFSDRKFAENAIKLYARNANVDTHWYSIIERELDRVFKYA